MGIRYLNNYLRDKCANSIRVTNIADLSGKKIAVDISIYLYKYEADNALLENIYLMLSSVYDIFTEGIYKLALVDILFISELFL
jgi:hypothetical protein